MCSLETSIQVSSLLKPELHSAILVFQLPRLSRCYVVFKFIFKSNIFHINHQKY